MSTADHTSMELEESALDSTAVDPATAAAAAAMSDLSDLPSAAIEGQLQRRMMSNFVQAETTLIQCFCVLRISVGRCPGGESWGACGAANAEVPSLRSL
jgi:hypothetical protein